MAKKRTPRFAYQPPRPVTTKGRFTMRFFMPEPSEGGRKPAVVRIKLGKRASRDGRPLNRGKMAVGIVLTDFRELHFFRRKGIRDRVKDVDQQFPLGVAHTLSVTFDLRKRQWTATLDGVQLTHDGDKAAFPFRRELDPIDLIDVKVGTNAGKQHHVFLDELELASESAGQ